MDRVEFENRNKIRVQQIRVEVESWKQPGLPELTQRYKVVTPNAQAVAAKTALQITTCSGLSSV